MTDVFPRFRILVACALLGGCASSPKGPSVVADASADAASPGTPETACARLIELQVTAAGSSTDDAPYAEALHRMKVQCLQELVAEQTMNPPEYGRAVSCLMEAKELASAERCTMHTCVSRQREARGNLKALYVAEEIHRATLNTYDGAGLVWEPEQVTSCASDADCTTGRVCARKVCAVRTMLEFSPRTPDTETRYRYTVLEASAKAFRAEARGTGAVEGDVWIINDRNELEHVSDACVP